MSVDGLIIGVPWVVVWTFLGVNILYKPTPFLTFIKYFAPAALVILAILWAAGHFKLYFLGYVIIAPYLLAPFTIATLFILKKSRQASKEGKTLKEVLSGIGSDSDNIETDNAPDFNNHIFEHTRRYLSNDGLTKPSDWMSNPSYSSTPGNSFWYINRNN